jgi:hypothetical protein
MDWSSIPLEEIHNMYVRLYLKLFVYFVLCSCITHTKHFKSELDL